MAEEGRQIIYNMVKVGKTLPSGKNILKDIYLGFYYGAKIGILGLNGSGKSTLMRIIAGKDTDFQGDVHLTPGYTIGHLEQEPVLDETKTVIDIVREGVQPVMDLLKEYEDVNNKFADPECWRTRTRWKSSTPAKACSRTKLRPPAPGRSTRSWKWPWTPCAAPSRMPRSACFPGVNAAAWPCAACCCKHPTSCCWTNPPTTWTPKAWPGWNSTSTITPVP